MDTAIVKRQIECLSETATIEQVGEAVNKLSALSALARELKRTLDDRMISYIQANGNRAMTIGTQRYWVGSKRSNKARNNRAVMLAVLAAADGDIEMVAEGYLSSDAFRPGACRDLFTKEQFEELFDTTPRPSLKTGTPRQELLHADERFVGNGSRQGTPDSEMS